MLGFLAALASAAEAIDVHFMWRPRLADPADELVLEAAVNGRASSVKKAAAWRRTTAKKLVQTLRLAIGFTETARR